MDADDWLGKERYTSVGEHSHLQREDFARRGGTAVMEGATDGICVAGRYRVGELEVACRSGIAARLSLVA